MIFHYSRIKSFVYFIILFIPAITCYSQQNNTDKQDNLFHLVNNKVDSFLENDFLLMNARYFVVKNSRAKGNPYFETNNDTSCRLCLDKKEYKNIRLIYDICDQKLNFIVEKTSIKGTILELNNQVITRFYLDNKAFVNYGELPLFPQSGFYEEIFLGKHLKVYAKWSKQFNNIITDDHIGEFNPQQRNLLFEIDGKKVDVSSKHGFLKIFAENSKKIKSFIRTNKIKLSKSENIDLVKLFRYADSFL
jgi:hypothetical protein